MKVTSRFVFFFMEVLLLGAQRKAVPDVPAYAERDLELGRRTLFGCTRARTSSE